MLVFSLCFFGILTGVMLFKKYPAMDRRKAIKFGIAISIISVTAFAVLFPISLERDQRQQSTMERNIVARYDYKFFEGYLKKVEYEGGGGKYETGKYFNLTYGDCTTQRRKFHFNYKTGEPISYSRLPSKAIQETFPYRNSDCLTTTSLPMGPRD